jgi:hypothetical protein
MKIDANLIVRTWLLQPVVLVPADDETGTQALNNPLIPLIGNRVWAGALPEGFDPTNQPGIVVSRGGSGMSSGGDSEYEIPITNAHIQIRVWAGINGFVTASGIYSVMHDWIDARFNISFPTVGYVMLCNEVVEPMDVRDDSTGYATVIGFFDLKLRDN